VESSSKRGRPKGLPDAWSDDRGYDSDSTRRILRWPGVEPPIGRRKTPHCSGLGRVRRVVERTIRWLKGLRRRRVRDDRLRDLQNTWDMPAGGVICFRLLLEEVVLWNNFAEPFSCFHFPS
jgi:hypothetical protein